MQMGLSSVDHICTLSRGHNMTLVWPELKLCFNLSAWRNNIHTVCHYRKYDTTWWNQWKHGHKSLKGTTDLTSVLISCFVYRCTIPDYFALFRVYCKYYLFYFLLPNCILLDLILSNSMHRRSETNKMSVLLFVLCSMLHHFILLLLLVLADDITFQVISCRLIGV